MYNFSLVRVWNLLENPKKHLKWDSMFQLSEDGDQSLKLGCRSDSSTRQGPILGVEVSSVLPQLQLHFLTPMNQEQLCCQ